MKLLSFILVYFVINVVLAQDLYQILKVNRIANENEIKKSFKKLSLEYHPDKNKNNKEEAKAKFIQVVSAYEVLSDPKKRKQYDEMLKSGKKNINIEEFGKEFDLGDVNFDGWGEAFTDMFKDFGESFEAYFEGIFSNFKGKKGNNNSNEEENNEQDEDLLHENLFYDTDVIYITLENLSKFYKKKENWIILFFSVGETDAFRYIQMELMVDIWINLAKISQELGFPFKVAAVDCDSEEEICEELIEIMDDATLLNYMSQFIENIHCKIIFFEEKLYNKNKFQKAELYLGLFSEQNLLEFISQKMTSFVKYLNINNYDDILSNEKFTKFIVFLNNDYKLNLEKEIILKHMSYKMIPNKMLFYICNDSRINEKFKIIKSTNSLGIITDSTNFGVKILIRDIHNNKDMINYISLQKIVNQFHHLGNSNFSSNKNKKLDIPEFSTLADINSLHIIHLNFDLEQLEKTNKLSKSRKEFIQNLSSFKSKFNINNISEKYYYLNENSSKNIYKLLEKFSQTSLTETEKENSKIIFLFPKFQKFYLFKKDLFSYNYIEVVDFLDSVYKQINKIYNKIDDL